MYASTICRWDFAYRRPLQDRRAVIVVKKMRFPVLVLLGIRTEEDIFLPGKAALAYTTVQELSAALWAVKDPLALGLVFVCPHTAVLRKEYHILGRVLFFVEARHIRSSRLGGNLTYEISPTFGTGLDKGFPVGVVTDKGAAFRIPGARPKML